MALIEHQMGFKDSQMGLKDNLQKALVKVVLILAEKN